MPYTAAEVAAELGCSAWFVKKLARTHGIGALIGGPTGYRFTDADISAMREVLRPPAAENRHRRRRRGRF